MHDRLHSRLLLLLALNLLGTGCSHAALELQLQQMPEDNPYSGLAELEVKVLQAGEELAARRQEMTGTPIELEPIERQDDLSVEIIGYDRNGEIVARGEGVPEMPPWDGSCCVRICFCTLALIETESCTCGDNSCRERCRAE